MSVGHAPRCSPGRCEGEPDGGVGGEWGGGGGGGGEYCGGCGGGVACRADDASLEEGADEDCPGEDCPGADCVGDDCPVDDEPYVDDAMLLAAPITSLATDFPAAATPESTPTALLRSPIVSAIVLAETRPALRLSSTPSVKR
ncbi:MAG TPA: hypothetical protein VFR95_05550, partial [Gemmatimonadaceae bacterium]|nr:hypothetical protein [Gemmatimonadaceae bacterium]